MQSLHFVFDLSHDTIHSGNILSMLITFGEIRRNSIHTHVKNEDTLGLLHQENSVIPVHDQREYAESIILMNLIQDNHIPDVVSLYC